MPGDRPLSRIVLASRAKGAVALDNFRLEQAEIPDLPPGGVLLRTVYLSLDPYMRGRMEERKSYASTTAIGETMPGESVCEVIASDHPGYAPGDIVLAFTGWASHAALPADGLRKLDPDLAPVTTGLGVLGMPGFSAWSGLMVIGQPKPGETVVVAAASGPVGSLVGQLARRIGCRVVGIAGGPEKCRYIVDELGFDAAIDHRGADLADRLAAACPNGIDVYFENIGGRVWQAVLPLLNLFARVPVCGLISEWDASAEDWPGLPATMRTVLTQRLTIRGFINYDFADEHHAAFLADVTEGVRDGSIRYREDVTQGLENAPAAFLRMLRGGNLGKTLVRIGD